MRWAKTMKLNSIPLFACGLLLGLASTVWAQFAPENPDWKESEAPPPFSFDRAKLVTFEVWPNSSLVYGVDPAAIQISKSDSLVRYVMVAVSASGASNVMYEALRCSTGEVKTYARHSADGGWKSVANPEWKSVYANMPSKHALRFARAGACDNATVPASVDALISRLKDSSFGMTR